MHSETELVPFLSKYAPKLGINEKPHVLKENMEVYESNVASKFGEGSLVGYDFI